MSIEHDILLLNRECENDIGRLCRSTIRNQRVGKGVWGPRGGPIFCFGTGAKVMTVIWGVLHYQKKMLLLASNDKRRCAVSMT